MRTLRRDGRLITATWTSGLKASATTTWHGCSESVASDDDWQGTLSDEEDLGEENAEDEQYDERLFALVARYMKKKGKLGGQNKLPRLSNDRKIVEQI